MDIQMGGSEGWSEERKERRRGEKESKGGDIYSSLSSSLLSFFPSFFIKHEYYRWGWNPLCPSPQFHFLFSLPRDNSCHEPACVDIVLYCYYTAHAHTPHIVLLCVVCQTWSNSYCVEPDVLELSVLPLFITFPSSIYVSVVQGLASFFHQGPGGKYFGLWGSHQGSVSYSFL